MRIDGYPLPSYEGLMVKSNIKPQPNDFSSILEKANMEIKSNDSLSISEQLGNRYEIRWKELDNQLYIQNTIFVEKSKANSSSSIWEELGKQYDIRNATFDEFKFIALKLYEAGEISPFDFSVMTLDKGQFCTNRFETSSDKNGRYDWIAEFEARAKQNLAYGNIQSFKQDQNIANFLRHLL